MRLGNASAMRPHTEQCAAHQSRAKRQPVEHHFAKRRAEKAVAKKATVAKKVAVKAKKK